MLPWLKNGRLWALLPVMLSVALSQCGTGPRTFQRLQERDTIQVTQPDSRLIDEEILLTNAAKRVARILSSAVLESVWFDSACADLPQLEGRFILGYAEDRWSLRGTQRISADVVVNTAPARGGIGDTDFLFEDAGYLGPEPPPLVDLSGRVDVKHIASVAYQHIGSIVTAGNDTTCKVSLRKDGDQPWRIIYRYPADGKMAEHKFVIEGTSEHLVEEK